MKIKGNGIAAVLTPKELKMLFSKKGFQSSRDKALFGVCLYTGCRISEALQLRHVDITSDWILFRKSNTKGKLGTREMRITPHLAILLDDYRKDFVPVNEWFFPGKGNRKNTYMCRMQAHTILYQTCERLSIKGVSTHSFRRTSLTQMSSANIPLRAIQRISGHRNLDQLEKYLAVTDEQAYAAVMAVKF